MIKQKMTTASAAEGTDSPERPFDYRETGNETAMICERDPSLRQKISSALKSLEFNVIDPATAKEALKYSGFHSFNIIIVNENFDEDEQEGNRILKFFESLTMSIRRQTFIVMISSTFPTMDDMNAYNKSVNLIINKEEISEIGLILKKEIEENEYFYQVFKEYHRKYGRA
jgi:hypothetical protein